MRYAVPSAPFHGRPFVPLPTGEESERIDREAITDRGIPSPVLMENAGRSAALVLDRIWPEGGVVVAAGGGNNGGDGIVLARTLAAQGRPVRILAAGGRDSGDPLLHGWSVPVLPVPDSDEELQGLLVGSTVLVDALLGTGGGGAPRGDHARLIRAFHRSGLPILALDLPSGVDAATGATPGEAVRADVTVAFGAPKLGCLRHPGRAHAGRLVAVEIGFPPLSPSVAGAALITPGWAELHRPRRPPVTHKKAAGWVLLVAGSPGMAGAAVLAARGALRAGAGYVQIASAAENREILQQAAPEAIFVDVADKGALLAAAGGCDVLAAGPGIGTTPETAARLDALLGTEGLGGVVLDADALTLLGDGRLPSLPAAATADRRLLTPHPGEMARLGASPDRIRVSPLEVCREGAAKLACALLLKGNPSFVAGAGEEPVLVSATGSSDLARGGVGDVLTGVAAAFLARGAGAQEAGALALHFTGHAARRSGAGEALLPSDLAEELAGALADPVPPWSHLLLPFVTLDLPPAR